MLDARVYVTFACAKVSLSLASRLFLLTSLFGQVLGLLVSVSLMHFCTYTSDLSTWSSTRDLTPAHSPIHYFSFSNKLYDILCLSCFRAFPDLFKLFSLF